MNWRAAVGAGVLAGTGATVVEIALWSIFTDELPRVFCRDARFAAAIVMSPEVLSPLYRTGGRLLAIAALLHFTLSIGYGMLVARVTKDRGLFASILIGAAFGLLLYAVNMYGFTRVCVVRSGARLGHRRDARGIRNHRSHELPHLGAPGICAVADRHAGVGEIS
ncbi:MAG: sodium:proline symporter [Betaproteobacteria bacterium]